jgi:hypothetical protein
MVTRVPIVSRRSVERRIITERYSASLMSNAKWRKCLLTLNDPDLLVRQVILKFVDADAERRMALPSATSIADQFILDSDVGPFSYRAIEWLEIPSDEIPRGYEQIPGARRAQGIEPARRALEALGRIAIEETDRGIRIVGHRARPAASI